MARYIDAERFEQRIMASPVFPNMGQDGFFLREMVLTILDGQPTADVAPKSEVAREIFAEIERLLDNYHSACLPAGEIYAYTYYEGGLGEAIAELKKKYTEGET